MASLFPQPKDLYTNQYPNKRYRVSTRRQIHEEGHDIDENYIGDIPKNTAYMVISLHRGSWNSSFWDELETAYENEGFNTYLRKSSGRTKTRSGTCVHAKTQLYVW